MASRTVSTLKFVGSISLGLLTGLSYTLTTLTLPTLLALPTATSASRAFTTLTVLSLVHIRSLATLSSSSFLLAWALSPRAQKHPYLLWTALFVAASGLTDVALQPFYTQALTSARLQVLTERNSVMIAGGDEGASASASGRDNKGKGKGRQMDASYEVLAVGDSHSEGTASGEEGEEEVNGEEVREAMQGYVTSTLIRTAVAGIGFAMSVVGIWGDGAADLVIIEM